MVGKINEIYGEIRIQVTKLQQDLALAQKKLDAFQKAVSPIFGLLAKTVAVAGAAITAAMTKATLDTVRYAEETLKAAQATGMATDELQELAYAAKQGDTSIEAFQRGMTQLLMQMSRARDGSEEAAKSFNKLGISYKNQDGTLRSTKDVLMDIADSMKGGKLSADQLAIATDLVGAKTMKELVPSLMKGSDWFGKMADEAHRFGIVMSEEDVRAAEEFGDKMDLLKDVVNGLKRTFATQLIPVLDSLIKTFLNPEKVEQYKKSLIDFGQSVALVFSKLPSIIGAVRISFESLNEILLTMQKHFAVLMRFETGWFTPLAKSFAENVKEYDKEIIKSRKTQEDLAQQYGETQVAVDNLVSSFKGLGKVQDDLAGGGRGGNPLFDPEAIRKFSEALKQSRKEMDRWVEHYIEIVGKVDEETSRQTDNLIDQLDESRAEEEKLAQDALDEQLKLNDAMKQTAESVGELFGTAIKSGGDWLAMLKKIIGQQIRYNLLSKLGWEGSLISGVMQVFGFQEGGFIPPHMPIINMAAINENPNRPEIAIDMGGRGTTAIPLEKIGKFIEVKNEVQVIGTDVFIKSFARASKAAFDEFWRHGGRQAMERDLQR